MNELKRKAKFNYICSNEAISIIAKLDSKDELYAVHETHYPDTRKDMCLVKKTFVGLKGSYDILYLIWKTENGLAFKRIWSTSIYDPPGEQHMIVSYMHEDTKNIVVKIYSTADPAKGPTTYPGVLHELSKEKLGIKN
ncbi:MAG: hypothetical protein WC755_08140 [Candidatus Woesearchaeota archaeon]